MLEQVRSRLTFANVVSVIALFIALGGGAYAIKVKLKANQVKTRNIAAEAVTGEKALESSFGKVPSAGTADNAANAGHANSADNAESLGGIDAFNYQLGNGFDGALASFVDTGGQLFFPLFEGNLIVNCSASPTIAFADTDNAGAGPETDLWINGARQQVNDGTTSTPVGVTLSGGSATALVQIWGGNDVISWNPVSIFFDTAPTPDECRVTIGDQENFNLGVSTAGATRALHKERAAPAAVRGKEGR